MPVILRPGPWVTAALRTGAPSAALSRGGSYWAHRFFGSEIENQNNWAGQVQVVPLFWSLGPSFGEGLGSRDARTHSNAASPGKPGSAFVAGGRSRTAGGTPPRSLTRPLVPNRVVLRRGRVAVPGASLGRGSRARLKRELNSRVATIAEF